MTTNTAVKTPTLNSMPSFKNEFSANYDDILARAIKGSIPATKELMGFLSARADASQKRVNTMGRPAVYSEHKANQARMKKEAQTYHAMVAQVKLVLDGNAKPAILKKLVNNSVLTHGYFKKYTHYDMQQVIVGLPDGNATPRRGMANYRHQDYGFFTPHMQGVLLEINDEQLIISAETAHRLIVEGINAGTFQRAPYTQPGVFPTTYNSINFDGCTMSIEKATFETITGESRTFPEFRLSMTHMLYSILVYSVAYARYYDAKNAATKDMANYLLHGEYVTKALYGDMNTIPANLLEMERFWDLYLALLKSYFGEFQVQSQAEQAAHFEAGRRHARRGLTCLADILDLSIYSARIGAFNAEQVAAAELRMQKAAARKLAREEAVEVPTAPVDEADALGDLEEHAF